MSSIENRIVSLKFDNAQFKAAIRETLATLTNLESKLKLDGAAKGLNEVQNATNRFAPTSMNNAVDGIGRRFSAMSAVALTAIATVTHGVITSATQMAKSFTIDPIKQGLEEYETQLNSVQTILANTQAAGTGLKEVNATLEELNHYSDQTIYNFAEMAKNIGTFTAAGVDLKTATSSIKGIANLAALSGSNSMQASAAMYQLSQAISAGRVSLEDWNSVVNAGMGGTVFQRALAQTAERVGTLDKGAVKLKGSMKNVTIEGKSFRESITAKPGQESWLTSEVLTKTLAQFTGDLKDAELAAMGFDKAQIKAIQSQAKTAKNAATEVKTLTQLLGTLKESASSGWAKTWMTIFGDFEEAKSMWTGVNNVLSGFVSASADARNKVLGDWKAMGGRTVLIEGIKLGFEALLSILRPIKQAFRDIFPAKTAADLYNMSVSLLNFTRTLGIGAETAGKLRRTFAGVFAIFGIGFEIVKQLLGVLFSLFQTAGEGSSGFLDATASVGDFLVKLHDAIKNGEGFKSFIEGLGKVLAIPIKALMFLGRAISSVFQGGSEGSNVEARFEKLGGLGETLSNVWSKVVEVFETVWDKLEPMLGKLGGIFSSIGQALSDAFSGADFSTFLDSINTGLFAALVLMFKNFLGGGIFGDAGSGIFEKISNSFDQLTGTLQAMQSNIKAGTLLKIAGAVALLTASVIALSLIDPKKLSTAMAALTAMFGQLIAAMMLFSLATAGAGLLRLPLLAAGLVALAIAIAILSAAVKSLSDMSWEELGKGLAGVTALILALVAASYGLSFASGGMIRAGAGMILMAVAIKLLASSVKDLSGMGWAEMAKGLVGVGALLAALGLFATFTKTNASGLSSGAGILLLAVGIKVLASALKDISDMSWEELSRGLVGMAGGLTAISLALMAIPPSSILSAAAILVTAAALGMLSGALKSMAEMSWGEVATGLTVLAGALTVIGLAMNGMTAALPGAAALLVVSAALVIFVPILQKMGELPWQTIATGLTVLAAALTIIGLAGLLLAPVVPALFGLAASVALLGGGMALAGLGVAAFAAGLAALAVAGAAGAKALVGIVLTLLGSVPKMVALVGNIVVAFAKAIEKATPAVMKAAVTVISSLLKAIVQLTPKILGTLGQLLVQFLAFLLRYVPILINAGGSLVIAILRGIAQKVSGIANAATDLIVAFLNAIGRNLPRVLDAGVKLIISFINGLASAIDNNAGQLRSAGVNLARAIIDGMTGGLASGAGALASKAASIAKGALNAAKSALGINSPSKEFIKVGKAVNQGFLIGLQSNAAGVDKAFKTMRAQISSLRTESIKDVRTLEAKLKQLQGKANKGVRAEDGSIVRASFYDPKLVKQIKDVTAALRQAKAEYARSNSALSYMDRSLQDDRNKLKALATSYDVITKRLVTAKKTLEDATKTRDDFRTSITEQYSDLPDLQEGTKLDDYLDSLRKQIIETKALSVMLQKLRSLGLNDTMYKELLAKGTDAMPFISELLDRGKRGVDELNSLNGSLASTAGSFGQKASSALYQAAVDSAKGLVDGLAKQQKNIDIQMNRIAVYMVNAIKKHLGIRSPSRVFAKIGGQTTEGLVEGLGKGAGAVAVASERLGKDAVDGLKKTISGMDVLIGQNVDMSPTIRPVIDMAQVKKDSAVLSQLMADQIAISSDIGYGQAKNARFGYDRNNEYRSEYVNDAPDEPKVSLTQNNYSPKALSHAELYRQTKNQLSVAKGALGKR